MGSGGGGWGRSRPRGAWVPGGTLASPGSTELLGYDGSNK